MLNCLTPFDSSHNLYYEAALCSGVSRPRHSSSLRCEPTDRTYEGRNLATLKLFLGTDPVALAEAQLPVHRQILRELEASAAYPALPDGIRLTTEFGINQERALIRFWSRIAAREG